MLYYECGLYIRFLKILKHSALRKTEATEVINFGFSKPEKEKFISSKKLLLILKILWTRRKILLNILARLIDQYVAFTYTEAMLSDAPRKRSCSCFVRAVFDGRIEPSQIKLNLNLT